MNANATEIKPPEVDGDGNELLQFNEEGMRALEDLRWIDRQRLLGAFAQYAGEYIGVFNLQVVGHNKNLIQLRIDVERDLGISPAHLATGFVLDSNGIRGGRWWLE